uniref:B30.2/SPRY domain-containing protein n=1 Tax=Sander lucioperca TaxID=283035 RepID=A0A8C9XXV1_SANLU
MPPPLPPPPFRVEPAGVRWLTPGLRKCKCVLHFIHQTVTSRIQPSDVIIKVLIGVEKKQPYPYHPERFDCPQLLCRDGLTGRCYWEVERRGEVDISVSYRVIRWRGKSNDCWFGCNDHSWSLTCSDGRYSVCHNNRETSISSSVSGRVAVYIDCPAGSLVSSDSLIHLHTFNTTFTQPLYPGFGFWSGSSVSLSPLQDRESLLVPQCL